MFYMQQLVCKLDFCLLARSRIFVKVYNTSAIPLKIYSFCYNYLTQFFVISLRTITLTLLKCSYICEPVCITEQLAISTVKTVTYACISICIQFIPFTTATDIGTFGVLTVRIALMNRQQTLIQICTEGLVIKLHKYVHIKYHHSPGH